MKGNHAKFQIQTVGTDKKKDNQLTFDKNIHGMCVKEVDS